MHRMFPRVSSSKLCQTRNYGGVGILDPVIQQNALQLRWLHQMLGANGTYPVHIQCLIIHILATSKFPSDFRVLFLFPSARKLGLLHSDSPVKSIYHAIDDTKISPDIVPLSMASILHLPLMQYSRTFQELVHVADLVLTNYKHIVSSSLTRVLAIFASAWYTIHFHIQLWQKGSPLTWKLAGLP
ncbi:hypothetical protein BJV82DRAFT_195356 [Fennellomyces sp. T-0311]|nr:hypothetical protein BJV82DRAFT_195356 [Fennellomyces sp. T-0311]